MKKKKNNFRILILLLLITTAIVTVTTISKYAIKSNTNAYAIESSEYYFCSSALGTERNYNDWKNGEKYLLKIDLKNFEDSQRYSTNDIDYEISIENRSDCEITLDNNVGTLKAGNFNTNYVTITIDDSRNNVNYADFTIKVTTVGKYQKTITSNFKIYKKQNNNYIANLINEEGEDTAKLNIVTYNNSQQLKISYNNEKVLLDKTDEILNEEIVEDGTISSITVTLQPNQSYVFNFIKISSNIEIINDVDIKVQ